MSLRHGYSCKSGIPSLMVFISEDFFLIKFINGIKRRLSYSVYALNDREHPFNI
jgi:hypothetical protein